MRIIAGALRGRRIDAPPGRNTRPMLDRVREALFSTIAPWLPDAIVLDLFAGSGSLGLEALSRGAQRVRFVEHAAAARAVLRRNIETLGVGDLAEVLSGDALAAASWLPAADVIFLDPPYALVEHERARVLAAVRSLVTERLAPEGVAVLHVEHGKLCENDVVPVEARVRRYGTNDLWYLKPKPAP